MYKMYLIKEQPFKIQVSCKQCAERGYISNECQQCNGKGIHNRTISIWRIRDRTIDIEKIDRCSKDEFYKGETQVRFKGELRYWTGSDCYYNERDKMIHFTKEDAIKECNERNIEKYGLEFYNQYLKRT